MLRTTAQDCWSAGIGGSGEWRGPPATSEARETVDYRPCIGPLSVGDPATSRQPRAARAGDTGLSPPAWSHRVALLHESSLARTMPPDRILTCRCDMTLVGRARSSD